MRPALTAVLVLCGCAAMPTDPLARAEGARLAGDLLLALRTLDAVPVAHPRYPEARAKALAVEQQMRKSQELLLQGMYLRTEWRDQEAIAAFAQARAMWQQLPGADDLIAATRSRLEVFGPNPAPPPAVAAAPPPAVVEPTPAAAPPAVEPVPIAARPLQPSPAAEPAAPPPPPRVEPTPAPVQQPVAAEPAAPVAVAPSPAAAVQGTASPPPVSAVPTAPPPAAPQPADPATAPTVLPPAPLGESLPVAVTGPATEPPVSEDVAARLAAIEVRLGNGELEAAIGDLQALQRERPDDPRVRTRVSRVLHQRALMRYGRGELAAAVSDWQRVIELDPAFEVARRLLPQAEAELAQRCAREKKAGG